MPPGIMDQDIHGAKAFFQLLYKRFRLLRSGNVMHPVIGAVPQFPAGLRQYFLPAPGKHHIGPSAVKTFCNSQPYAAAAPGDKGRLS